MDDVDVGGVEHSVVVMVPLCLLDDESCLSLT